MVSPPRRIGDAVEAGRAILAEGGNAIEAMIAMASTIAVVFYPHMNHIGVVTALYLIRRTEMAGARHHGGQPIWPAGDAALSIASQAMMLSPVAAARGAHGAGRDLRPDAVALDAVKGLRRKDAARSRCSQRR